MSMSSSSSPSSHRSSSGGRTSGSFGNSRAMNLDHHEVRCGEAKASGSRLRSK